MTVAYDVSNQPTRRRHSYFGLPHGETLPGPAGNQLVAADFSQAPPADCPRLR